MAVDLYIFFRTI